jgi:NAD(P)-dependent dehydrogenase (short-subunit alcohol dehydrogenase family)
MNLANKTIVITGGGGALGSTVAMRAAEFGARTVLLDRQFGDSLRLQHECLVVNLGDAPALANVVATLGPIDVMFAIAGGFDMGATVTAADDSQWQAMFDMNVSSLRNALKAIVPGMQARGSGRVVTVGALSAQHGKAAMSAYTAAKAVVMNLTESLAAEVAATPIRVNAVLPGMIDTPANRASMPAADYTQWTSPLAIADVMCFLASDASSGIHGALIPVSAAQG